MILTKLPNRGSDDWGNGEFGSPRGSRTHKGIDYACYPLTQIFCSVDGIVTKLGYPYGDDLGYRYVEVTDGGKFRHRYFYVEPCVKVGQRVNRASFIGTAQDIAGRYSDPTKNSMKNHIHYEILMVNDNPVNPEIFHELVHKPS